MFFVIVVSRSVVAKQRCVFVSRSVVAIESLVSKLVGKFRVRSDLSLYIGGCHRIARVQMSGEASEMGPSYFYLGGCHRIARVQIRGKASELGPSYFYLGGCH